MRHTLVLRQAPPLRLEARALLPASLSLLSREQVLRLALVSGRSSVAVGECFAVGSRTADDALPGLRLEGDLSRFDCIGAEMAAGMLDIEGQVGDCLAMGMAAGVVKLQGTARDLAACAMRGGLLAVSGDVGDFAAAALPGEMDGMRGGTLVVHGRAGERLADRLRRGTVVVHGDAGDFPASRMVAGTLAIGGRCGQHAGWGMRRGSIVFPGDPPRPPSTFVPVHSDACVIWQLLARDLARFGGRFADLPRRQFTRWVGDLAVAGQGEWLVAA